MSFIKNPIVHGILVFAVMFIPVFAGFIPANIADMTIGSVIAGVLVWLHGYLY